MSFKDMVERDVHDAFLNLQEFGSLRTVIYNGRRYRDIPVVLTGVREWDRNPRVADHGVGLYKAGTNMHCAFSDLQCIPEKGKVIQVNDRDDDPDYLYEYRISEANLDGGMIRLRLEAIDE